MKYIIPIILGCYSPNLDGGFRCENRNLCPPNQQCCWDRVCRPECTDPSDASTDLGKSVEPPSYEGEGGRGDMAPDAQPPPDQYVEHDMNPCEFYQRVFCVVEADCDEACGVQWSCMGEVPSFCGLH